MGLATQQECACVTHGVKEPNGQDSTSRPLALGSQAEVTALTQRQGICVALTEEGGLEPGLPGPLTEAAFNVALLLLCVFSSDQPLSHCHHGHTLHIPSSQELCVSLQHVCEIVTVLQVQSCDPPS